MPLHLIERMVAEDEGEGDAVVCIHGLGGSANTFGPLLPALQRCRVLRPDLPGSGRSQRAEGPLTIQRYVDAVQAFCDRAGIPRAHVVGHSMGTIVAQHLAVQNPRLVRSLALFGPLITPPDPARNAMRARATKAREGVAGLHEIVNQLTQVAVSSETRQNHPLAVAFVRESLMRQEPEAYARSCEALAGAEPAAVDRIACPVLLVTGDEDGVAPPQAVRAMAEKIAGARVQVLSRCGHWTPVERPEDCQRALREFLSSVRG
ncbi:alpha/beta fold hydrolase [Pseudorhodoferax sp. Leaf274]|uniref:alpha/beta fold hydrolase n=1 Tax=Pseudorhodoferax sp. Leaf274 TaxID=1736318 RepID=UPI000702FF27|nr:alpha/beta hydrolase [Pseudorhodoferax sp. Leaf274]KQP49399.1 alpha/beta hydrolase [Pseudorhodoferax sp. Leaf274]